MHVEDEASLSWDRRACQPGLHISRDGSRVTQRWPSVAAWLGVESSARIRDGLFEWDYLVRVNHRQLGVGLMLDPPDWGFFGYLGAGVNAWAYDPLEGAIVTQTEAIHRDLPRRQWFGVVSVRLDLRADPGFTLTVAGQSSPRIPLPSGATIVPAACFLRWGQSVRVANFRSELGRAAGPANPALQPAPQSRRG